MYIFIYICIYIYVYTYIHNYIIYTYIYTRPMDRRSGCMVGVERTRVHVLEALGSV